MGVAENIAQRFAGKYTNQLPVSILIIAFFSIVTILLTWPILLTPDKIHLTAPPAYSFIHDGDWFIHHPAKGQEHIDHLGAMATIEGGAERLLAGENPIIILSNYTIPPSYTMTGIVVTILFPISVIAYHNLFFVVSMSLSGIFTFLFVREVLEDVEVSIFAGVLYMSSFYIFNTYVMGHVNQWQIQWIPLILFGVERLRLESEIEALGKSVVLLGVAFAIQVLSSLQYSAYLSFMLPLYILLRSMYGASGYRSLGFWKGCGMAMGIAILLTAPYLHARYRLVQSGVTEMTPLQADQYPWYHLQNVVGEFFAGDAQLQFIFRLLLVVGGFITLVTVSRHRFRQLVPFSFLFGIGVVIAWGPFSPWAPYVLLHKYWPLIEYFRVPYRMLPFALLGASTLSASLLLHFPDNENGWAWHRWAVLGILTAVQIGLVHYLLVFSEYMR